jgi:hypothetical protein
MFILAYKQSQMLLLLQFDAVPAEFRVTLKHTHKTNQNNLNICPSMFGSILAVLYILKVPSRTYIYLLTMATICEDVAQVAIITSFSR